MTWSGRDGQRPRVRLVTLMGIIALIAVAIWVADRISGTTDRYWRNKPYRDAWNGTIVIQVRSQDELLSVLKRVQATTVNPSLKYGLPIALDRDALETIGLSAKSPIGVDLDARAMPLSEFLGRVLRPMGLACTLREDRKIFVTLPECLDEPFDYLHHGEMYCQHGLIPVLIRNTWYLGSNYALGETLELDQD
jgi:hypothetical protein